MDEIERARRVVVVDDNELTLGGFAEPLRASPGIDLIAAIGHHQAMAWSGQWADVDVVVVDAADEEAVADQFPGVQVVRRIRDLQGSAHPVVIVVTGHFMNDGLRYRMAAADADFFFLRAELRSADVLRDVVRHPERYRRGVPPVQDEEARRLLGVTRTADVDRLVGYVDKHGLHQDFDAGPNSRADPRSRAWFRHRRAIAEASHISPRNITTGGLPGDNQRWPSFRQLSRIYRWAARVQRPSDGPPRQL